jgi:hypothetical protein
MPSIGPYASLNGTVLNPISTSSGAFGGEVLGLEFNVDFADFGVLLDNSGIRFGDLTLCGFSTLPALNGTTVRQFLATVSTLLSGGSAPISIADLVPIIGPLNAAFSLGDPLPFAQDHLVNGSCPP